MTSIRYNETSFSNLSSFWTGNTGNPAQQEVTREGEQKSAVELARLSNFCESSTLDSFSGKKKESRLKSRLFQGCQMLTIFNQMYDIS